MDKKGRLFCHLLAGFIPTLHVTLEIKTCYEMIALFWWRVTVIWPILFHTYVTYVTINTRSGLNPVDGINMAIATQYVSVGDVRPYGEILRVMVRTINDFLRNSRINSCLSLESIPSHCSINGCRHPDRATKFTPDEDHSYHRHCTKQHNNRRIKAYVLKQMAQELPLVAAVAVGQWITVK